MQLSGEPFAEAMGRDLGGYSRDFSCQASTCDPSLYHDPALNSGVAGGSVGETTSPGSRQRRRVVRVLEAADEQHRVRVGRRDRARLRAGPRPDRSHGGRRAAGTPRLGPAPRRREQRRRARFVTPTRRPTTPSAGPGSGRRCSLSRHGTRRSTRARVDQLLDQLRRRPRRQRLARCNDYECDYTTLHLPNRAAQVTSIDWPGVFGLGRLEGSALDAQLPAGHARYDRGRGQQRARHAARARRHGRQHGHRRDGPAAPPRRGTFLGSSDIEGFQAGNFLQILDNQARSGWRSSRRPTARRSAASRPSSDALAYRPASPLRWFPGSIAVTESDDASGFPSRPGTRSRRPTATCSISAGMLGAYSSVYALTDQSNTRWAEASPRSRTSTGIPSPSRTRHPPARRRCMTVRSRWARPGRQHRSAPRGSSTILFVDDVDPRRRQRRARERRSRPTSRRTRCSRCAPRAERSTPCSTLYRTQARCGGRPQPARHLPAVRRVTFGARSRADRSLSHRLLRPLTPTTATRFAGWDLAQAAPPTTARASTRTRPRSAACSSRTSLRGTRSSATARAAYSAPRERLLRPERAHLPDHRGRHVVDGDLHAASLRSAPGRAARYVRAHRGPARPEGLARAHRRSRRAPQQARAQRLGRPRQDDRHRVARASAPTAPGRRQPLATGACRWPSASLRENPAPSSTLRRRRRSRASSRPTASTTASPRSPPRACLPRWPTRSPSRSPRVAGEQCTIDRNASCSSHDRRPPSRLALALRLACSDSTHLRAHGAADALEPDRDEPGRRPPLRRPPRRR